MPNRITFTYDASEYTVPINPAEYDAQDDRIVKSILTVEGQSIEQAPVFDGRPRQFSWRLPNKSPYKEMIAQLKSYVNVGTVALKLRDLSGDTTDTTSQDIRVLNVEKVVSRGPASADGALMYNVTLIYVPVAKVN